MIGDRVFYVMADGTHKPEIHEAWVEEADESHILVRSTASAFGGVSGNGRETRGLKQPQDFVVVKGQGFIERCDDGHYSVPGGQVASIGPAGSRAVA